MSGFSIEFSGMSLESMQVGAVEAGSGGGSNPEDWLDINAFPEFVAISGNGMRAAYSLSGPETGWVKLAGVDYSGIHNGLFNGYSSVIAFKTNLGTSDQGKAGVVYYIDSLGAPQVSSLLWGAIGEPNDSFTSFNAVQAPSASQLASGDIAVALTGGGNPMVCYTQTKNVTGANVIFFENIQYPNLGIEPTGPAARMDTVDVITTGSPQAFMLIDEALNALRAYQYTVFGNFVDYAIDLSAVTHPISGWYALFTGQNSHFYGIAYHSGEYFIVEFTDTGSNIVGTQLAVILTNTETPLRIWMGYDRSGQYSGRGLLYCLMTDGTLEVHQLDTGGLVISWSFAGVFGQAMDVANNITIQDIISYPSNADAASDAATRIVMLASLPEVNPGDPVQIWYRVTTARLDSWLNEVPGSSEVRKLPISEDGTQAQTFTHAALTPYAFS